MAKTTPNPRRIAGRRVGIDRPAANEVLTWDAARQEWVPKTAGSSSSPLTTKGDVYTRSSSADARLGVGTNGQVLSADSTESTGLKWIDAPAGSSPLTAKGDLYTRSSSADDNLPVGTDGYVLTADSSQSLGIKWAAASTGGIATGSSLPTPGSGYRATMFMLQMASEPDRLYVCGLKADGSTYEWRELLIFGP